MCALAATQVPKPVDHQAFERGCVALWRELLRDLNVQRHGLSVQEQQGVDFFGLRGCDPPRLAGVQLGPLPVLAG